MLGAAEMQYECNAVEARTILTSDKNWTINGDRQISNVILSGEISGETTICPGQTSVIYTVPKMGNAVSYNWILPAGATGVSDSSSIAVDFGTTAAPGNITVQGIDSCDQGPGTSLYITVNRAPTANAGADQSVVERREVTLHGLAFDPDGDFLSFRWSSPGEITLSADTVSNPTFTAPSVSADTSFVFILVARDGCASSSADTILVRVTAVEIPVNISASGFSVIEGAIECINAMDTITLAGPGTIAFVNSGGSLTLVAGKLIRFLSGFHAFSGSFVDAYITTDNIFCNGDEGSGAQNPQLEKSLTRDNDPSVGTLKQLKVYPNPTTENFILELTGETPADKITVDVYGIWGEKVLTTTLNGERKHEFSLSDKPSGVYFIHVVTGDKTETLKIIKQ